MPSHPLTALRLFAAASPHLDVWALAGPRHAATRAVIMSTPSGYQLHRAPECEPALWYVTRPDGTLVERPDGRAELYASEADAREGAQSDARMRKTLRTRKPAPIKDIGAKANKRVQPARSTARSKARGNQGL